MKVVKSNDGSMSKDHQARINNSKGKENQMQSDQPTTSSSEHGMQKVEGTIDRYNFKHGGVNYNILYPSNFRQNLIEKSVKDSHKEIIAYFQENKSEVNFDGKLIIDIKISDNGKAEKILYHINGNPPGEVDKTLIDISAKEISKQDAEKSMLSIPSEKNSQGKDNDHSNGNDTNQDDNSFFSIILNPFKFVISFFSNVISWLFGDSKEEPAQSQIPNDVPPIRGDQFPELDNQNNKSAGLSRKARSIEPDDKNNQHNDFSSSPETTELHGYTNSYDEFI